MPTGPKGEKRPSDVIGNAVHVMRVLTGEITEQIPTPAICDTLMTWEQIVEAMDADAPKTGKRGPYKNRKSTPRDETPTSSPA
jgi:hypothetical protein